MHILVTVATAVVVLCLWLLTLRGAHALTGRAEITLVLGALVILQWVAARRAIDAWVEPSASWTGRAGRFALPAVLWLASASVTVSLVGGELFGMFSAREAATSRFDAEQSHLRQRARELGQGFGQTLKLSEQYASHARAMVIQEETRGHSCAVNMGIGPGDIRNFRRTDSLSANHLVEQLRPQVATAAMLVARIDELRFTAAVPELRRQLGQATDELNGLLKSPLWAQVLAFVEGSSKAAADIRIGSSRYVCDDRTRTLLLDQMQSAAQTMHTLPALVQVQLLDPKDDRAIAQATVLRTWAGLLAWLPKALWEGKPLLEARVRQQYAIEDNGAVLNGSNMPLIWAWMLEFILLGLMAMAGRANKPRTTPTWPQRALRQVMEALARRPGTLGRWAGTLLSVPAEVSLHKPPYFSAQILFADAAMEERACTVAPWYRPWGARDMLAIPSSSTVAVRSARELWHAGLLHRVASALPTGDLMGNAQLARVMRAQNRSDPSHDEAWDVYQVTHPHFLRWLLAQPVEARAALAA